MVITTLRMPDAFAAPSVLPNGQHGNDPKIEVIPLDQLIPYARNARTHSPANVKKLAASLKEYGWTSPVLVTDTLEIIAGHGRVLAAQSVGLDKAPCIRLGRLTDAQVRAYRLADNRLGLDSDWDEALLKLELTDLVLDSLITGFSDQELDQLLNRGSAENEDDAPPLQEEAVSSLGDIWLLGSHRLICGDCTDAKVVAALLDGAKPNLMVTDPPYGVEYDPRWRTRVNFDGCVTNGDYIQGDKIADWSPALQLFTGNVAYVWHGGLHGAAVQAGIERIDFEIRAQIIWVKHMAGISRGHYSWQHEPCFYAVRKGKTADWIGGAYEPTVWEVPMLSPVGGSKDPADQDRTTHAAQKPVEVMRRPMTKHGKSGDLVYEPFMGSGTTLIAAETTHRVAYGCEIEPAYIDMAVRRWQAFTGKTATRLSDGEPFTEIQPHGAPA